ncbi:MAG: hypothetical protein ACRD2Y_14220 [Terriglobales bacterium]
MKSRLSGMVLWFCLALPLTAVAYQPAMRNLVVRLPVAHLHDGAACYGYLYFSPGRIRYEVARPQAAAAAAAHSFDVLRTEVSAQPAGSNADLLLGSRGTYRFLHLPATNVERGQHQAAAALPARDLLAAVNHFARLSAELDSGGQRPRGAPGLSVAIQKLVTDPGGVEVLVDGVAWGSTDVESGELVLRGIPFGEHNFTLRRRGFEPVRFPVAYEHERTGEIFAAMKRLHADPQLGSLLLEDVLDMLDGDVPPERIAVLVRKKGVGLDLAGEAEQRRIAAAGKALERRKQLAELLAAGATQDTLRGNYSSAISALEFAVRLDPANPALLEALQRTRRARETELEVLSRR